MSQRDVRFFDVVASLERALQRAIARGALRDQKYAARLAVDAMPEREEHTGSLVLEKLDERVAVVARGRVHREVRGLVDGEQVIVFVEDFDLGRHRRLVPSGAPEQYSLLRSNARARAKPLACVVVGALAHDHLRARAARPMELALQEDVDPLPGDLGRDAKHGHDGVVFHAVRARELVSRLVSKPRHGETMV